MRDDLKQSKIAAVVVAYNNPNDLRTVLVSLLQQTHRVTKIFVIDNSANNIQQRNEHIVRSLCSSMCNYRPMPHNSGSAGGFAFGMQVAFEEGYDWIWLLDQDGTAADDCLEKLLECRCQAGIRAPIVLSAKNEHELRGFRCRINLLGGVSRESPEGDEVAIDRFGTHGILISREVIAQIGVYDDRYFFVGFEDYDFAIRAKQAGVSIVLVRSAKVFHPCLGDRHSSNVPSSIKSFFVSLSSVMPPYLGFTRMNNEDTRKQAIVSYGYIVARYSNLAIVMCTIVYSILVTSLAKVTAMREVQLLKSLKAYCDGIRQGLRARKGNIGDYNT